MNIIGMTNNDTNYVVTDSKWDLWGIKIVFGIEN